LFTGPGDVRKAIKNALESHSQLHFSNARSKTLVHTVAEGNVLIHIVPMQVKGVGVGENVGVTVGGAIPQHHFFIFGDALTVEFGVFARCPTHVHHR